MSSFVYYKFRASRGEQRVSFEGTGISVYDLKRDILLKSKISKGSDFDLHVYNSDSHEEYKEDRAIVPRSTSVLVRRLPAARPGQGTAAHYIETPQALQTPGATARDAGVKSDARSWLTGGPSKPRDAPEEKREFIPSSAVEQDEASALANLMAQSSQQWEDIQTQMDQAPRTGPAYRPTVGPNGKPSAAGPNGQRFIPQPLSEQTKPPPPGYVCFRCRQKGHWIQFCPTNFDPEFENKPRYKRTTGIPRSFLTTVDASEAEKAGTGVMMTAEGGYVIANPDRASWEAHRATRKNLTPEDVQNLPPRDPDLTCPVCSKLLKNAVLSPCCETSFCEGCFSTFLQDNDNMCPECDSFVRDAQVKPDEARREKAAEYTAMIVEESRDDSSVDISKLSKKERKQLRKKEKEAAAAKKEQPSNEANGETSTPQEADQGTPQPEKDHEEKANDDQESDSSDSDSDDSSESDSEFEAQPDHLDDLVFSALEKKRQRKLERESKSEHAAKVSRKYEKLASDAVAFLYRMQNAQTEAINEQFYGRGAQQPVPAAWNGGRWAN